MVKLPEPPPVAALARFTPMLRVLPAGTSLWRIYFRGGAHPATWNQFRRYGPVATSRFDQHQTPAHAQERGILYAALHGQTCVAEVFQHLRIIEREASNPWLVGFALAADLTLLDLTTVWPTAAGASMAISTGSRSRARRWSVAIYEAYPEVQGLFYPSSMNANQPAVALYERAGDALPPSPKFHRALSDPILFTPIVKVARSLNYQIRPVPDLIP